MELLKVLFTAEVRSADLRSKFKFLSGTEAGRHLAAPNHEIAIPV